MKQNIQNFLKEFFIFGLKEARSCIFAGAFFILLITSTFIEIPGIPRYDFLFIGAILIQVILVATKIETWQEVKMISIFHIIGLVLEIFKTHPSIGSWAYPEFGYLKILGVPLYSGFMYAAVGSYVSQAWKVFNLKIQNYPSYFISIPLATIIYLNFFTKHFFYDIRWILMAGIFIIFWKTKIYFTITDKERSMPLSIGFFLIAFFIWIAENIATFFKAWEYVDQRDQWVIVDFGKISSWFLLFVISFIAVAHLKLSEKKF